jgi:hypothetical protein
MGGDRGGRPSPRRSTKAVTTRGPPPEPPPVSPRTVTRPRRPKRQDGTAPAFAGAARAPQEATPGTPLRAASAARAPRLPATRPPAPGVRPRVIPRRRPAAPRGASGARPAPPPGSSGRPPAGAHCPGWPPARSPSSRSPRSTPARPATAPRPSHSAPMVRGGRERPLAWRGDASVEAARCLRAAVQESPAGRAKHERLRSLPSRGPVSRRTRRAAWPEWGTSAGSQRTALVGRAPVAEDSGPRAAVVGAGGPGGRASPPGPGHADRIPRQGGFACLARTPGRPGEEGEGDPHGGCPPAVGQSQGGGPDQSALAGGIGADALS